MYVRATTSEERRDDSEKWKILVTERQLGRIWREVRKESDSASDNTDDARELQADEEIELHQVN